MIEVLQDMGNRVKAELFAELATKKDLAELRGDLRMEMEQLRGELRTEIEKLRGEFKIEIEKLRGDFNARMGRMEVMMKVLIGLAVIAIAFFSPAAAELIRLLR